ncbi:phage holin family protein [Flavobacterium sp. UMI-01]|uniref:phage holin family protein n=1 Tax=Flavobacterium sp. UMI-01 TaxID=1441053 RepID=UPI001C7CD58B|nr:phage holin family protein [Flavobacterium sp. UMI-01]GIZ08388.1 hypothetical protein FUMI01_11150 [Flavobacterium sp. UMI-01]
MKEILTHSIIKPISLAVIPPSIAIAPVVNLKEVVFILVVLFLIDFATGLLSSYFTWAEKAPKGKYFFGQSGGFSSDKFKKCFVKGIIYGGFPLVVLKFQQTFLIKNMSFSSITDVQIDITTICLLVFCANELFSIFWENLPNCGLNIPKGIRDLILGVKKINDKEEE